MKTEYSFDNETWYDAPEGKAFVPGVGEIYLRMTNETTASQPKSIGDDALGEFIDEYEWRTDEFCHKPTETERLMLLDFAVNLDDSRAPAAQAFATIQAAPKFTVEVHGNQTFIVSGSDSFRLAYEAENEATANWHAGRLREAVTPAATIQEPVMVAKPVGKRPISKEWSLKAAQAEQDSGGAGIGAGAAPMVADHAGVAPEGFMLVQVASNTDEIVTRLYRRFKDWSARGFGPDDVTWCEVKADVLAILSLTATVKAVPSEALELAGMVVKATFGDHKILVPRVDLSGKGIGTLVYFAAPLADKTGGGE